MTDEQLADYQQRLERAAERLASMTQYTAGTYKHQLEGKRQGVLLALDYLRGY